MEETEVIRYLKEFFERQDWEVTISSRDNSPFEIDVVAKKRDEHILHSGKRRRREKSTP